MKAIVLCAGYGTRLGSLTREVPKPMLGIGDSPLLEHTLRHIAEHGFREMVVNLHFQAEQISSYFGDGSRFGIRLHYVYEPELLGTAGAVKNIASFLRGSEPFLVHYGDILTNQDFTAMLAHHRERRALATLLLHQRQKSNSVVHLDYQGRVLAFWERPSEVPLEISKPYVFSGVCLCEPEFIDRIPEGPCDLPRDLFSQMAAGAPIYGYALTGYRCAIDSPQRLEEARQAVADGKFQPYRRSQDHVAASARI